MTSAHSASLWRSLASAGIKATAEALDADDFQRMHVSTSLDAFIDRKVRDGFSIVLTGNAGDGKTHLLRHIMPALQGTGAVVITDATASMTGGQATTLLDEWRKADSEGRPFCIAANEYPLYQLRQVGADFGPVAEVSRQCRDRLAYSDQPIAGEEARHGVLVIDLSLRNPLAPTFASSIFDALMADAPANDGASGTGIVAARNAERLKDPRVRRRLDDLFRSLIARGRRATIRELWIIAARMIYGAGETRDYQMADWYSEALFTRDARFDLTGATQDVDPATCSNPALDDRLELRDKSLHDGWFLGEPTGLPPHPVLPPDAFSALKRRFYFEHQRGMEVFALADPDATEFKALLSRDRSVRQVTGQLVDALNAAYCPVAFPGRVEHLYLWSGHRFHEQPSRAYVAAQRVSTDDLQVMIPRLPSRLSGAFEYEPDHLALVASHDGRKARLHVDFALFRSLRRLSRGLPRKLVPERDVHRIDAFIERLSPMRPAEPRTLWSVHVENLEVLEVTLSADKSRYEEVRRRG